LFGLLATFSCPELVICPQLVKKVVTRNSANDIIRMIERLFKMAHNVHSFASAGHLENLQPGTAPM
jgi:hypothetical protein